MSSSLIDLTGKTFGRLTVIGHGVRTSKHHHYWICLCSCGNKKEVSGDALKGGLTKSCGCYRVEFAGDQFRTHGHTSKGKSSPEFRSWSSMLHRCKSDPLYAGRGISVCERWQSFENFLADMGKRPSLKYSIDRINNDGNYEPSNCRWATDSEQALNRRHRSVCWHGHPLTDDNVCGPRRRCRICQNARRREQYQAAKEKSEWIRGGVQ